ncbi:MAG: DUF2155 domain-containing protein [Alphaproteobacteria bacterium]
MPTILAFALAALGGAPVLAQDQGASSEPRQLPAAVLGALDKVTARVSEITVPVGDRAEFFRLSIDVYSCQERVVAQRPESAAFLVITETPIEGEPARVFNGWMFASSPSVSAMDHPVYDVWLVRCDDPARGE